MSVTNVPVAEFVVVEFVIILSIRVAVLCVMRVGLSILGMNECVSVMLMKALVIFEKVIVVVAENVDILLGVVECIHYIVSSGVEVVNSYVLV